jgi:hypothetical protein
MEDESREENESEVKSELSLKEMNSERTIVSCKSITPLICLLYNGSWFFFNFSLFLFYFWFIF